MRLRKRASWSEWKKMIKWPFRWLLTKQKFVRDSKTHKIVNATASKTEQTKNIKYKKSEIIQMRRRSKRIFFIKKKKYSRGFIFSIPIRIKLKWIKNDYVDILCSHISHHSFKNKQNFFINFFSYFSFSIPIFFLS